MLPLWDPNPSCPLILECSAKTFQVSLFPSFRSLLKCPLIRSLPWPHNWQLSVSSSPLPADIIGHSFTLLCFSSSLVVVNPRQPALQLDTSLLQTLQHMDGQWFFSGWRLNRSCAGLWLMTYEDTGCKKFKTRRKWVHISFAQSSYCLYWLGPFEPRLKEWGWLKQGLCFQDPWISSKLCHTLTVWLWITSALRFLRGETGMMTLLFYNMGVMIQ